ncbi:hypothetical protein D3C71_1675680 [compost metagenome]
MLAHESGGGQRRDHVARQLHILHIGVVPGAVAHHQVGVFGHHIKQRDGHLQRQVDLGIGLGELAQARDQDGARERGRHRQLEAPAARRGRSPRKTLQRAQPLAHMRQIGAALGGQ